MYVYTYLHLCVYTRTLYQILYLSSVYMHIYIYIRTSPARLRRRITRRAQVYNIHGVYIPTSTRTKLLLLFFILPGIRPSFLLGHIYLVTRNRDDIFYNMPPRFPRQSFVFSVRTRPPHTSYTSVNSRGPKTSSKRTPFFSSPLILYCCVVVDSDNVLCQFMSQIHSRQENIYLM